MKKIFLLIVLLSLCFTKIFAQNTRVEMADVMRSEGKIYVVVAVLGIILLGILIYLILIDRKITKLEKEFKA